MSTKLTEEPNTKPAHVRLAAWFARWSNALAGLLVFCIILGLAEYLVQLEVRDQEARQQVAMFTFTSKLRSHVSEELNRAITQVAGLKSYLVVRHNNLRRAEVDAILEELSRSVTNIRNISIAVGYRIAYVYPVLGNEKAVGLDYRKLPKQWPDVRRAAQTGNPVLAGPLELVQGGLGLIYRLPVFIEGRYWGMLSTVFDAPILFKSIFGHVEDDRFDFAVRRATGNGAGHDDAIWGQQSFFEEANAKTEALFLPGGRWEFTVRSRLAPKGGRNILLLRVFSILLAAVLGWSIYLALVRRALLAQIALHDTLTGLPNRRLVEDRMNRALRRQARNERTVGVILFIDLEGFKGINDKHGHRAGDSVLQTVAARATRALRDTDTVGRWGGDELLVLMENTDRAKVEELTERIRQALESPMTYQDTTIRVGASIGRAVFPDDGASLIELVRVADRRMYEDKQRRTGSEQQTR